MKVLSGGTCSRLVLCIVAYTVRRHLRVMHYLDLNLNTRTVVCTIQITGGML